MTWRPLRSEDERRPTHVASSLDRLALRLGTPGARPLAEVFTRWSDVVGPVVAAHCQPLSLRGGVLVVGVDEPAWATELRYLGHDVVRRVADTVGEGVVERLEVRVRPAVASPRHPPVVN